MKRSFNVTRSGASSTSLFEDRSGSYFGKSLEWDELLKSRRILLIAEAGAGKTHECKAQAKLRFEQGDAAFFLSLEKVAAAGVRSSLGGERVQRFDGWRSSSSQTGYFFLDSVDELQLVYGDFREALERFAHELEGALGRAVVVVTSRPVDIDRKAFADVLPVPEVLTEEERGESFASVAVGERPVEKQRLHLGEDQGSVPIFREVSLMPLSDEQVVEFAREQKVADPDKLMAAIRARHAGDFARRPYDLIELCDAWKAHKGIRPHFEQIKNHISVRLRPNKKRKEVVELTEDKARQGVQRLALAAILSKRLTIRHSPSADVEGSGDASVVPEDLLGDFTSGEMQTLLQRPIFGEGGYGRVRFHHRSVLEFLAACQVHELIERGVLAVSAAKRMLFSLSDSQELLSKPSMRPVAGWLSLMRTDVFDAVLKVDPSVLLKHGDPESLSDEQCARALDAYVHQHGVGDWRGLDVPILQIDRLARKPLHDVIRNAWSAGIENPEVRQILLRLISAGRYRECADVAYQAATGKGSEDFERFLALEALITVDDYRLDQLLDDVVALRTVWKPRIGRWVAEHLYPDHLSEEQLLALLLGMQRSVGSDDGFPSSLAGVIEQAQINIKRLEALLPGLLALTQSLVVVLKAEESLGDKRGRLRVSYALRALCCRLLEHGSRAPDLIGAAVLAFRAAGPSSYDQERKQKLGTLIDSLPSDRRREVFDADYACITRLYPRRGIHHLLSQLLFHGPMQYSADKDGAWIFGLLADPATDGTCRSTLIKLVAFLFPGRLPDDVIATIRSSISDSPPHLAELDSLLTAQEPSAEFLEVQDQQRKREERRKLKLAGDKADWMNFWRDLANRPALALAPGRSDDTIWNVAKVMRKSARNDDRRRWDRAFLERSFPPPVVDALRLRLMKYWRGMKPSLPNEREDRGTYLVAWTVGLMGLYAEAEDPRWVKSLTPDEAELAIRYALVELNSLPDWLAAIAQDYPQVIERVLGSELDADLRVPGHEGRWHSMLLQTLRYGRREIARELQPKLLDWLQGPGRKLMAEPHNPASEAKLDQVIRVLLAHAEPTVQRWLIELATRQAIATRQGPYLEFWLPVLMRLDPRRAATVLLHVLETAPVEKEGVAVRAVGSLFSQRRVEGGVDWSKTIDPDALLRLTRAVYRHVRQSDDVRHEGAYSPRARDNAQDGRRYVFDALIDTTGAAAYQAKLELSADPLFKHAKDRIAALAQERLAEEADSSVASMEELAKLFQGNELGPMTTTDMAHLVSDRLDDLQDLMGRDNSPRNAWAFVSDENSLRAAIAHQLENVAKGAYTIDQEGVTIEGKEMDIRFQALSKLQACIELKIGEKPRSGRELRDTIEDQLIRKYMWPKNAKVGCLLVSVADADSYWTHPDTGRRIDRHGLQEMLHRAAQDAQRRLGGEARVMARVLDLTPRLPTEPRGSRRRKSSTKGATTT